MTDTKVLIGVTEAATILGVSREHAHQIVKREKVERFRIGDGRKFYVRQADVERLAAGDTTWRRNRVRREE